MQLLAPISSGQLAESTQQIRLKLEIWTGAAWVDMTDLGGEDYLKSIGTHLGGAYLTPDPVAGSWTAEIDNPGGIFHPLHPTSAYSTLLRMGRRIRISVGGLWEATENLWPRIIGHMDEPRFNAANKTVSISGLDYTGLLADAEVQYPNTHWGDVAVFDSQPSSGATGPELYPEGSEDAAAESDTDAIGDWDEVYLGTVAITSVADAGAGSSWALDFEVTDDDPDAPLANMVDAAELQFGVPYTFRFWAKRRAGLGWMDLVVWQQQSPGVWRAISAAFTIQDPAWAEYEIKVTPIKTGTAEIWLYFMTHEPTSVGDAYRLDEFRFKAYDPIWYRYELPETCNGPYFVTLDGEPVWQGDQDGEGWFYDEVNRYLYFSEKKLVAAGVDNLLIYHYTDQAPEELVADFLALAGLYADRAAALAAMDYTPTGYVLERVWFEPGTKILEALQMVCERADYRFWHDFEGTPCFHPAAANHPADFVLEEVALLADDTDAPDLGEVRNRIIIEGAERQMYATREEKVDSRYKADVVDLASRATYRERSHTIQNYLFQSQAVTTAAATARLAAFKDPKLYAELQLPYNPVPLEIGDVISWQLMLDPPDAESGATDSGTTITVFGLIRDIQIDNFGTTYKCEIVPEFESGSASASGSGSASASASASESCQYFEDVISAPTDGQAWEVPAGVCEIEAECWGAGGPGADGNGAGFAGGGGGGGGYAKSAIPVTPGETLTFVIGDGQGNLGPYPHHTQIKRGASVLVQGNRGTDAAGSAGGAGGLDNVGDTTQVGGDGGGQTIDSGGGGGGSGAPGHDGRPAFGMNGGSAWPAGGGGGSGGVVNHPGSEGTEPGGGGGGGGAEDPVETTGANGQPGRIRLRYNDCSCLITEQWEITVPAGVYELIIEAWGHGGHGGHGGLDFGGGGAGGGAYGRKTLAVNPGEYYYGAHGGTASSMTEVWKEDLVNGDQLLMEVDYGVAGEYNAAGTGGQELYCTGCDQAQDGGDGHFDVANDDGGGGGSAAGNNTNGNPAVGRLGGASPDGIAGKGGDGGIWGSGTPATGGGTPGGGGGGAYKDSPTIGGSGGQPLVLFSYMNP